MWLNFIMITSSNGKIFRWEFTGHVEFLSPRPVTQSFDVLFGLCTWTNDWVNNRDACYLRSYRARYDVTAMCNDNERLLAMITSCWMINVWNTVSAFSHLTRLFLSSGSLFGHTKLNTISRSVLFGGYIFKCSSLTEEHWFLIQIWLHFVGMNKNIVCSGNGLAQNSHYQNRCCAVPVRHIFVTWHQWVH